MSSQLWPQCGYILEAERLADLLHPHSQGAYRSLLDNEMSDPTDITTFLEQYLPPDVLCPDGAFKLNDEDGPGDGVERHVWYVQYEPHHLYTRTLTPAAEHLVGGTGEEPSLRDWMIYA